MIYDTFIFNNELDILEVRFNTLSDHVDRFVLVEADKTFTGYKKDLFFHNNKNRFAKFLDRLIHIKIDISEPPLVTSLDYYDDKKLEKSDLMIKSREVYQRNSILLGLNECRQDDIILVSDVDEIPKPSVLSKLKLGQNEIVAFEQKLYCYYLNCLSEESWRMAKAVRFGNMLDPEAIREAKKFRLIKNAGWHFSYIGGVDEIKNKIKSYAHQEYDKEKYTNADKLNFKITNGIDIFDRPIRYSFVDIDQTFPDYLRKNKAKYKKYIKDKENISEESKIAKEIIQQLQLQTRSLESESRELANMNADLCGQLSRVYNSKGWKLLSFYRNNIKPILGSEKLRPDDKSAARDTTHTDELIRKYLDNSDIKKLHLGCGEKIFPGWLNSDLNEGENRISLDVTQPFPLENETIDYVYSEHMIEHLTYAEGIFMLNESCRALKKGGKIRLATPDLKFLIDLYTKKKTKLQKEYIKWAVDNFQKDIGIYMDTFVINNFVRAWGHRFIYDYKALENSLKEVGFRQIKRTEPGVSNDKNFQHLEVHGEDIGAEFNKLETMVVEAVK